jgi:hypothetical protein
MINITLDEEISSCTSCGKRNYKSVGDKLTKLDTPLYCFEVSANGYQATVLIFCHFCLRSIVAAINMV